MTGSAEYFDEMSPQGETPRPPYAEYCKWLPGEDLTRLRRKSAQAEATERLIPAGVVLANGSRFPTQSGVGEIMAQIADAYHAWRGLRGRARLLQVRQRG
jgi:uncharacterized circularly permuted ATP-grasp superfamily protein